MKYINLTCLSKHRLSTGTRKLKTEERFFFFERRVSLVHSHHSHSHQFSSILTHPHQTIQGKMQGIGWAPPFYVCKSEQLHFVLHSAADWGSLLVSKCTYPCTQLCAKASEKVLARTAALQGGASGTCGGRAAFDKVALCSQRVSQDCATHRPHASV